MPGCVIILPKTIPPKTVSGRLDLSFGIFARQGEKYSCYTIFATMPHESTAKDILIMSYDLSKRLVIGLASSALFDLSESDNIFRMEGAETYRQYQREKQNHPLKKALSFHLLKNFCQSMK